MTSILKLRTTSGGSISLQPTDTAALLTQSLPAESGTVLLAETGAANAVYVPAGTGAVDSTVQGKLRDTVSVKDFGAVGDGVTDDTAAIQAAINYAAGRPILLTQGTYKITSSLEYDTTGLGNASGLKLYGEGKYKSLIDNRSGTDAIYCSSGTASEFQYEVELSDFSIINTTASANTIGITLSGVRQSKIKSVRVADQASHGLFINGANSDNTACSQITIEDSDFSSNGGWGAIANCDVGGINSTISFKNVRFIDNTLGGVAAYSVTGLLVDSCAIAYNGGIGLAVGNAGVSYSKAAKLVNNEFDSNTTTQCQIGAVVGAYLENNYFICNTAGGGVPAVTKQIDVTTSAIEVFILQSIPRLAALYSGVTMYTVASGAAGVFIANTVWSSWVTSGNTKYTNAGTNTTIIDDNTYLTPFYGGLELSGGGLLFPSTQVPSANVNNLDDYKEGTWTPIDSSGAGLSLAGASGHYTKIGRLVTISGQWALPATGSTANIVIGGLPYTAGANAPGALLQATATAGDMLLIPSGTGLIYIYGPSLTRRTNANYSAIQVYMSASYIV